MQLLAVSVGAPASRLAWQTAFNTIVAGGQVRRGAPAGLLPYTDCSDEQTDNPFNANDRNF